MPVVMDFSPIGSLADTFFNARDKAITSKLKQYELSAPGEWAKIVAEGQGSPSLAPSSPDMTPVSSLGQPKAPTFAAIQGTEPSANFKDMFSEKERQYALPPGYLSQTASIESRFNPNAQNPNSSAGGLFQFIDSTAKQYGLANKFDPAAATDAAARLAADNKAYLARALGREPTAGELYLAHQQGAGGAAKILSNPNARAVDVVGADAVRLNGGDANMTAGQFASRWTSKVDGKADLPAPGAQPAQYVIPGQQAPAQAATPPMLQIPAGLQAAMNSPNPYVRQMAAKRVEALQDAQRQWGMKVMEMQAQEASRRRLAQEQRDYDRSKPMAVGPEQDLITGDGVTIRQGKQKPIEVNGVLVDPNTYQPVYTAPRTKTEIVNGRIVHIDENAASAKDITPQGLPSGYRPMTSEEKASFGIPENTGAMIGPDGKPATLPGTANTTVKLPTVENEYDKGQGKDYSETFTGIQKSARAAIGTKNTLALMDRLTRDPNFYSGWGAEGKLQANQFLASLGVKDPNASAPTEVFRGLVNDVILGKLGGSLGAGVSNGDVTFMQSTAPNLTNTKEGNQLLIQFAGRMADRQQQIGQMARKYAAEHGGRIDMGFDDELAKWANENPLFTEQDFRAAQTAAKGVPVDTTPKPARERPLPQGKDRVELPPGYNAGRFIAEAKAALKTKDRAAVEEELWKRGIDPKRLDD